MTDMGQRRDNLLTLGSVSEERHEIGHMWRGGHSARSAERDGRQATVAD